jgi:tRNA A37 threonylcarbamoyladenosine biosynthesis protein TsaE
VHHFDLYRVEDETELRELGLDDAHEDGALLIEWPERGMPGHWAADALNISLRMEPGDTMRELRIAGPLRWRELFSGIAS